MTQEFGKALGKNPWLVDFPCIIQNINPVLKRNEIILADQENSIVEVAYHHSTSEYLSIFAGKQLIDIFGTWNGQIFLPISLIKDGLVCGWQKEYKHSNSSFDF